MEFITKNNGGLYEFFIKNGDVFISISLSEANDILDGCKSIEDIYLKKL